MTTKFGWGARIVLLYLGFVALIIILVVSSMKQDFELVSKDYYAEEIAYQGTIDASKNQSELSAAAVVTVSAEYIDITLPHEFSNKVVRSELYFYSPVSASLDKMYQYNTENGSILIARKDMKNVRYKLKLSWVCEGEKYYQEMDVDLTK